MANALSAEDTDLNTLLVSALTDRGVAYCDLSKLDARRFAKIIAATNMAYDKVCADGPASFHDPKFYPGYIKGFGTLLEMLRSDPRASG